MRLPKWKMQIIVPWLRLLQKRLSRIRMMKRQSNQRHRSHQNQQSQRGLPFWILRMRLPKWNMKTIAPWLRLVQRLQVQQRELQNLEKHTLHRLHQRVTNQVKMQQLQQRKEQNLAKHTMQAGMRAICHLLQRVKSQVRMEMPQRKAQNHSKNTIFRRLLNQTNRVAKAYIKRQKG